MQTYLRYPHKQWQFVENVRSRTYPIRLIFIFDCLVLAHGYRISSIAIHEHVDRERSLAFSEKHPSIEISRIAIDGIRYPVA